MRRSLALFPALFVSLVSPSAAQRPKVLPPDEVARAVIRADSAGDWLTLLRLAHPEALARFRALQTFQLRMLDHSVWPGTEPMDSTVEEQWQRVQARQARVLLDSVFQVPDADSLAHTSPDTVLARWVRWARAVPPADSAQASRLRLTPYRVAGAVRSNDSVAYVVVVRQVEQPLGPMPEMFRDFPHETEQTDVMVMRRWGKEWRSMLDGVGESFGVFADIADREE